MTLIDQTKILLEKARANGLSLKAISECHDVDYEWLKKYAQGKIKHPSVNRIQSLHDGLRNLKRRVAA